MCFATQPAEAGALLGSSSPHPKLREVKRGANFDGLPEKLVNRAMNFLKNSNLTSTSVIGVEFTEYVPDYKTFSIYIDWHIGFKIFTYSLYPDQKRPRVEEYTIMLNHVETLLELDFCFEMRVRRVLDGEH